MRYARDIIPSAMTEDELIASIANLQEEIATIQGEIVRRRESDIDESIYVRDLGGLSVRTFNALAGDRVPPKYRVNSIGDVLAAGRMGLMRRPGLGKVGIAEIEAKLASMGLTLRS